MRCDLCEVAQFMATRALVASVWSAIVKADKQRGMAAMLGSITDIRGRRALHRDYQRHGIPFERQRSIRRALGAKEITNA